jgi:hypothetical protein
LIDAMQRPGSGLFRTFNEVGLAVAKATQGQQIPWVSSSPISGNFYFAGKPAMAAASPAPVAPHAPVPAPLVQEARLTPSDDPLRHDLITDCDRLAACLTIPAIRQACRAWSLTRSASPRRRRPATTQWRDIPT